MTDPQMVDLGKRDFNPEELNIPQPDPSVEGLPAEPVPAKEVTGEPSKKEYTQAEKQLYARAKAAEEELKELKKKSGDTPKVSSSDPFDLAKTVASLKDYDSRELDFASMISKAKGISPQEAVQTEDFKIFLEGKRALDIKNNSIPRPNSSAPSSNVKSPEDIAAMTDKEFEQYEKDYRSRQQGRGI